MKYDLKSDSSAAKKLMPDVCKNADPAVTETYIRCLEKPLNTLFDHVYENKIAAKTVVPVDDDAVPACSSTDPVKNEKTFAVMQAADRALRCITALLAVRQRLLQATSMQRFQS